MVESLSHTGYQVAAAAFPLGRCLPCPLVGGTPKEGKRNQSSREKKSLPVRFRVNKVLFHTRKRGITKELLPGGFAATLSLVVEEEMPPLFVAEEESMSLNARLRSVQVFS